MNVDRASHSYAPRTIPATALEQLLDEDELADLFSISVAALRRWRVEKQGPPYLKIGAAVRYRPTAIATWLDSTCAREASPSPLAGAVV